MTPSVYLVAAARPNFMKVAPLFHRLRATGWCRPVFVHTGQHYDPEMSDDFLRDLALPAPDHHLGVGSGSHAEQTAGVMVAFERVCQAARPDCVPDCVVVVGDVNSTLACTLAAKKLGIPVAHLEAGLRSFDRTMPEELNRILTDAIADLLWTPSPDADDNLAREGVAPERIDRVGNIMIDSLEMLRGAIERAPGPADYGLAPGGYGLVTLHRPANVDDPARLAEILTALQALAARAPLLFPAHPRTLQRIQDFGLDAQLSSERLRVVKPLSYVVFMGLVRQAGYVLTDSGGLQEETTYLGIPCFTLRTTTERPITVSQGTNRLVEVDGLLPAVEALLDGARPAGRVPDLWDGRTAERADASLKRFLLGAGAR